MNSSEIISKSNNFNRRHLLAAFVSLVSLAATFIVSNADLNYAAKLTVFAAIIVFCLSVFAVIYLRSDVRTNSREAEKSRQSIFSTEIEAKLQALEEANQFFGASLKSTDMFRLIANRVNEIIPHTASAFYTADEKKEHLKAVCAVGGNLKKLIGVEFNAREGLAGKTFQSRQPQIENTRHFGENEFAGDTLSDFNSAISVPLFSGENVFGVLILYDVPKNSFKTDSLPLIESVGVRVAPLFLSSRAFENSLSNALTDSLTNLPNERAFFLVLENQIAEAQRFRERRPLTILSIDVVNFGEHNRRFGHATGDRLLLFAADKIRNQLRGMDFLARSAGDEFLAVLPTASEEIAREIVERVEKTFVTNSFAASGGEKIHLQLSFGAASFGKDGETASQLLKHALLRKQQSKSKAKDNKILFFPKEYVN
ncbi:MAG: sensor domain-containing diguanylate cyclase [Pyrinomonadaceae bacterium]|nr:sensor domain-containing diguanylate cyclase [Pyrinomonadaceae bacterium]